MRERAWQVRGQGPRPFFSPPRLGAARDPGAQGRGRPASGSQMRKVSWSGARQSDSEAFRPALHHRCLGPAAELRGLVPDRHLRDGSREPAGSWQGRACRRPRCPKILPQHPHPRPGACVIRTFVHTPGNTHRYPARWRHRGDDQNSQRFLWLFWPPMVPMAPLPTFSLTGRLNRSPHGQSRMAGLACRRRSPGGEGKCDILHPTTRCPAPPPDRAQKRRQVAEVHG